MKKAFLFFLFVAGLSVGKAQCIYIYASEKIKGVEIPITRTEFDVVINDTIKKHLTSSGDGSLGRISLPQGLYTVKIMNPEYQDGIRTNVIVRESRTSDVIINLNKASAVKEEDKLKKLMQD